MLYYSNCTMYVICVVECAVYGCSLCMWNIIGYVQCMSCVVMWDVRRARCGIYIRGMLYAMCCYVLPVSCTLLRHVSGSMCCVLFSVYYALCCAVCAARCMLWCARAMMCVCMYACCHVGCTSCAMCCARCYTFHSLCVMCCVLRVRCMRCAVRYISRGMSCYDKFTLYYVYSVIYAMCRTLHVACYVICIVPCMLRYWVYCALFHVMGALRCVVSGVWHAMYVIPCVKCVMYLCCICMLCISHIVRCFVYCVV